MINKRESLADIAYKKIENMIVFSKIPAGCIKTEKELSKQLEIGRMPVREAIIRLSLENAVRIIPYKGIYFPEIDLNDFFLQLETRRVLEALMAGKAAKFANSHEREELLALGDQFRDAVLDNNVVLAMELDDNMNKCMEGCCRNPFIGHALQPLYLSGKRLYYRNFYSNWQSTLDIAYAHRELAHAIANGDEDAAVAASNKNIDIIVQMTRSSIGTDIYKVNNL